MFFMLFFWLDMAFLLLGIGYLQHSGGAPMLSCIKAGGWCGLLAAFLAWYNAFAGIADASNRYVSCAAVVSTLTRLASSPSPCSTSPGRTRHGSPGSRTAPSTRRFSAPMTDLKTVFNNGLAKHRKTHGVIIFNSPKTVSGRRRGLAVRTRPAIHYDDNISHSQHHRLNTTSSATD